jgi:DNA-directed RNA polymerase specialized sigma24 family protein
MNDRLLVEALRSGDPAAIGSVYDAYAERVFAFCWFLLRSREAAEVALRDTLIVAYAHIGRLRDHDRFAAWLYAIARVECARHPAPPGRRPDIPVARHDQDDVDQRIIAWQAVMGLPTLTRDVLELLLRHGLAVPDLAAVCAVSPKEVEATLARSGAELRAALTAEILAHEGPYGCPERAALLRTRLDALAPGLRARLLRHATECEVCGAFVIDIVSPAKVYGLLPRAVPAPGLRRRVLSCFTDPALLTYRTFVTDRVAGFTKAGFPVARRRGWDQRDPYDPAGAAIGAWRRLGRVAGGVAATAAIAGTVVALVRWADSVPGHDGGNAIAFGPTPTVRAQPTPVRPGSPVPPGTPGTPGADGWAISSSLPAGCPAAPPAFVQPSPLDRQLLGPAGARPAPAGGTAEPTASPSAPSASGGRPTRTSPAPPTPTGRESPTASAGPSGPTGPTSPSGPTSSSGPVSPTRAVSPTGSAGPTARPSRGGGRQARGVPVARLRERSISASASARSAHAAPSTDLPGSRSL